MFMYHLFNYYGIYLRNIRHSILALFMENIGQYTRNIKKLFPTVILSTLVTYNSSVTAVKIEVIAGIKFQLHTFHFGGIF